MNVVKKKSFNKAEGRPSIPQVNPVFAKPAGFLNHFPTTKKPNLQNTTYPARPNYKYESPWIQRSTSGESTTVSDTTELTRRRNSRNANNEADSTQTSSSKKSDSLLPPVTAGNNFPLQIQGLLPNVLTPNSPASNRKLGDFVSTSSSSRSKEKSKATPKSTSSGTTSTSNQTRVIIAITEGRGNSRGEVGLAAIDVRHPCLILCQLSDTLSYRSTVSKLNILNPSVIIFPNTFVDNQHSSKLLQTIQAKFPSVNQTSLNRKYFNDEQGISMIKSLHLPECSSIELLVMRKYYTLAAAAALLKYVEYIENITLASASVPMEYQAVEKMMLIDFETMHHLELILSQNLGVSSSLFGILNHCLTFSGRRRLRSAILQPSRVLEDLENRFDCVNELVDKPGLLHSIQNALAKVPDIESLLKICFISKTRKPDDSSLSLINYIILLKTTLDTIPSLYNILSSEAKTKQFEKVTKCLKDPRFEDISSEIDKMLCKDTKRVKGYAASQFQRCFAIQPDINGLLDVARYTYSELVSDFQSKVAELANDYEIPLKCQNTGTKGFHIQLNIKGQRNFKVSDLPSVFIQVQKSRNIVTMITEELIFINERIKQALQEIQIMTNVLLQELIQKIREKSGCLYNLCDRIAELDLIVSLARVSCTSGYIRPTFGTHLVLKSSRHPILDIVKASVPIPNDVNATNTKNFHIITGPNMGGKSIYIKQVALIQIMAQIGCYVPAECAELKLIDHLFSRIGFEDSIECNASTFVLELREIQHIIRSATESSLVIIDEFGRGTSSEEGSAIAWAVSEVFIHLPVYVFFATHFLFVTKLREFYPNVSIWNFGANVITQEDSSRPRLEFTHKLVPGVISLTNYGLKLAEMTALSDSLKETASKIARNLVTEEIQKPNWHMTEEDRRNIQLDELCHQLMDMVPDDTLDLNKIDEIILESNIIEECGPENTSDNDNSEDNLCNDSPENNDLGKISQSLEDTCINDNSEDNLYNDPRATSQSLEHTNNNDNLVDNLYNNLRATSGSLEDTCINDNSEDNSSNNSRATFQSLEDTYNNDFEDNSCSDPRTTVQSPECTNNNDSSEDGMAIDPTEINRNDDVNVPKPFATHLQIGQDEKRNESNNEDKTRLSLVSVNEARTNAYSACCYNALNAIKQYESPTSENSAEDSMTHEDQNDCNVNISIESRNICLPADNAVILRMTSDETTDAQSQGHTQVSNAETTINFSNPQLLAINSLNSTLALMQESSWDKFWETGILNRKHQYYTAEKTALKANEGNVFSDQTEVGKGSSYEKDSKDHDKKRHFNPNLNSSFSKNNSRINSCEQLRDQRNPSTTTQKRRRVDSKTESNQNTSLISASPSTDHSKSPVSMKTPANDSSVERKYSSHSTLFDDSRSKKDLSSSNQLKQEIIRTFCNKHPLRSLEVQHINSQSRESKQYSTDTTTSATERNYGEAVIFSPFIKTPDPEAMSVIDSLRTRPDSMLSATTKSPFDEQLKYQNFDPKANTGFKKNSSIMCASKRILTYSNHNVDEQLDYTSTTDQSYLSASNETITSTTESNEKNFQQAKTECPEISRFQIHQRIAQPETEYSSRHLKQRQALQLDQTINSLTSKNDDSYLTSINSESPKVREYQDNRGFIQQQNEKSTKLPEQRQGLQLDPRKNSLTSRNDDSYLTSINSESPKLRGYQDNRGFIQQQNEKLLKLPEQRQCLQFNQGFPNDESPWRPSPPQFSRCINPNQFTTDSKKFMNIHGVEKKKCTTGFEIDFPIRHQKPRQESSFLTSMGPEEKENFHPRKKQATSRDPRVSDLQRSHLPHQHFQYSLDIFDEPRKSTVSDQHDTVPDFFMNNVHNRSVQKFDETFSPNNQISPRGINPRTREPSELDSTFSRPVGFFKPRAPNDTHAKNKQKVNFEEQPEIECENSPRSIDSYILTQESQFLLGE